MAVAGVHHGGHERRRGRDEWRGDAAEAEVPRGQRAGSTEHRSGGDDDSAVPCASGGSRHLQRGNSQSVLGLVERDRRGRCGQVQLAGLGERSSSPQHARLSEDCRRHFGIVENSVAQEGGAEEAQRNACVRGPATAASSECCDPSCERERCSGERALVGLGGRRWAGRGSLLLCEEALMLTKSQRRQIALKNLRKAWAAKRQRKLSYSRSR